MNNLLIIGIFFICFSITAQAQKKHQQPNKAEHAPISWNAKTKLCWADFKHPADVAISKHALTTCDLKVSVEYDGSRFSPVIQALFIPDQSWTKSQNSDALLAHEKLHFDITELHARKLRFLLLKLPNPERLKNEDLQKIINKAFADWQQMEEEYDQATNHGLMRESQKIWEETISSALKQLD